VPSQRIRNPTPALAELRRQCRAGETDAVCLLHFGDGAPAAVNADWDTFVVLAAQEFRRLQGHTEPARRAVPPGRIDFHRLHCLALDRLPELLAFLLPIGTEAPSEAGNWCWFGSHPNRRIIVAVCLLSGAWDEPATGKGGRDLVSLYGHLFGVSGGRAAHMLAEWLGAELRAYA
jgi:hypothetical protein